MSMSDEHRRILDKIGPDLHKDLDVNDVIYYLVADGVLFKKDVEQINSKATSSDKVGALLDILPRRGAGAYVSFQNSLMKTDGSGHLYETMKYHEQEMSLDSLPKKMLKMQLSDTQGGSRLDEVDCDTKIQTVKPYRFQPPPAKESDLVDGSAVGGSVGSQVSEPEAAMTPTTFQPSSLSSGPVQATDQESEVPDIDSSIQPLGVPRNKSKYDIFLYYTKKTPHVAKLTQIMTGKRWRWVSEDTAPLGWPRTNFIQKVLQELRTPVVVVLLCNEDMEKSGDHNMNMMYQKFNKDRTPIVIVHDHAPKHPLPLQVEALLTADINDDNFTKRFKESIEEIIGVDPVEKV